MSAPTGSPAFDARLAKFQPLTWQVQAITQSFEMTAAPFALVLEGRPMVIGDQVTCERIAACWEAFRVLACLRDELHELARCQDGQRILEMMHELVAGSTGLLLATLDAERAETERLRVVLRATHERYCTESWTSRGLHALECLLSEVEP